MTLDAVRRAGLIQRLKADAEDHVAAPTIRSDRHGVAPRALVPLAPPVYDPYR